MSISELSEKIEQGQNGEDILAYHAAWHIKYAYPFAAIILSLFGLRFGYQSERRNSLMAIFL